MIWWLFETAKETKLNDLYVGTSYDDIAEFQPVFCAESVGELMRYFKKKE